MKNIEANNLLKSDNGFFRFTAPFQDAPFRVRFFSDILPAKLLKFNGDNQESHT